MLFFHSRGYHGNSTLLINTIQKTIFSQFFSLHPKAPRCRGAHAAGAKRVVIENNHQTENLIELIIKKYVFGDLN